MDEAEKKAITCGRCGAIKGIIFLFVCLFGIATFFCGVFCENNVTEFSIKMTKSNTFFYQ